MLGVDHKLAHVWQYRSSNSRGW